MEDAGSTFNFAFNGYRIFFCCFDGGRHKNDQTSHFQPRTFGTVTLTRLTVIITERVYDYSSSTTDIQPQLETTQL